MILRSLSIYIIWDKVFENGPSEIRLPSTNITWFILEYFVPFVAYSHCIRITLKRSIFNTKYNCNRPPVLTLKE